jgi:hypothetical protein
VSVGRTESLQSNIKLMCGSSFLSRGLIFRLFLFEHKLSLVHIGLML